MAFCPSCNSDHYYYGLNGHDCINKGCTYYNKGKAVGAIVKVELEEDYYWVGKQIPYSEFCYLKTDLVCANSNSVRPLVYRQNPYIVVVCHDRIGPNFYAGFIGNLAYDINKPKKELLLLGAYGAESPTKAVQKIINSVDFTPESAKIPPSWL